MGAVSRTSWWKCNGPEAWKRPQPGQTGSGSRAERPNGHGNQPGRVRSGRSGALTLEWRPPRGGSRCRRAKGRYEQPGPDREAASGEPESTDPVDGENVRRGADRRNVRRSRSRSSMPCMPVVSGLEIGSLGTTSFLPLLFSCVSPSQDPAPAARSRRVALPPIADPYVEMRP